MGIVGSAVAAILVERLLINRLRGAPVISLAILTIGVDLIIVTELTRRIGSDILNLGHPWGGDSISLGGVGITTNRALAIVVAAVLIGAFFVTFKYSSWGISMRAAAEDGEAAALMGIRMGRVSMFAWMIAGVLAAVAGLFAVGAPTPGVTPAVATVALSALPAAILGGLDSTGGALVGGILIGLAESLAAGYQDQIAFLGRGFGDVVPGFRAGSASRRCRRVRRLRGWCRRRGRRASPGGGRPSRACRCDLSAGRGCRGGRARRGRAGTAGCRVR